MRCLHKAPVARLPFIDWVRGFAVVAMVLWHTGDGWLAPGLRDGQGWACLRFVGGLAAPSFLFLAGAGAALAARQVDDADKRARIFRGNLARGLEIVIFGYLLRFQTWMIDAAAITHLSMARSFVPLGVGYGVLLMAVKQLDDKPKRALKLALLGAALIIVGLVQVESMAKGRLSRLLQVDVLQAIGTSLVLLALLHRGFNLLRRPRLALLLGVVIACATHFIWTHLPGPLPHAVAGFFGKYATPKGVPAALFPLFPWLAYACLGASVGSVLRDSKDTERTTVLLGVGGAALAMAASEAHPYLHDLFALQPWTTHPVRIAFRVGIVLTLFIVGWVWASKKRGRVLLDYGRTSLRIYWAHMFVAYGVLGRKLQKSSNYTEWIVGVSLVLVLMWLLSQIGAHKKVTRPTPVSA